MRKALSYCIGMILLAISALAQTPPVYNWSGFYIGANAGYNWPHAGGFNGPTAPISGTGSSNSVNSVQSINYDKGSYGTGLGVNLNVGYMLNEHLGLDLQVGTIFGKKNIFEYTNTSAPGIITETFTTHSRPWYVAPSVLISSGATKPLSLYSRVGVVFPVGGTLIQEYMRENDIVDIEDLTDEEYDFAMSKGLLGSLGIGYRVSPALSVNFEIRGMSLTRYVKSSEVTMATSNGVDILDQYDIDQRESEYSSNYTYDPATQTATMPSQRPVIAVPYSNFGVNLGAVYNFNAAPAHDPNDTMPPRGAGLYGRVGLGYNGPHAGNNYIGDGFGYRPIAGSETYTYGPGTTTIDFKKASYGSGLNIAVAGGYMINPYVGAELGIGLILPRPQIFNYDEVDSMGTPLFSEEVRSRANAMIFLQPAIVLSTGTHKPLSLFARAGLMLPFGGDMVVGVTTTDHPINEVTETEEEFKFGMSKGLHGALGIQYNVTDALGLTLEANGTSLSRYVKSSEYTNYTINGVDQLGLLTTAQRETEYSREFTTDPMTTTPNAPTQSRAFSSPFSTYGVSLGARFRF